MNNEFKFAIIADIHFGAVPPSELFKELCMVFLDKIKKTPLDMIVIAGDFYNSILTLNSKSSQLSFLFMKMLLKIARENKIKYVRIIEGTLSHDNNQLTNFQILKDMDGVDFDIIMTVHSEVLTNGMRILYVPEEYMDNPEEYYKPYLEAEPYDLIFGHGMFKETSFGEPQKSELQISKAPILDSKKLLAVCKGPIFFGHIHIAKTIKKRIFYCGSFSRWCFGEEAEKGFYLCTYNWKTYDFSTKFIVNTLARLYNTVTVSNLASYKETINGLLGTCKQLKETCDRLRILIIILATDEPCQYELNVMREYYSNKPEYKLEVINKQDADARMSAEEQTQELKNEYSFLFDNGLSYDQKIQKFIQKKYTTDIETERIKDILSIDAQEREVKNG